MTQKTIAFQGTNGAYSDMACRGAFPDTRTIPCKTFDDAFEAVRKGDADLGMIAIDNTLAGRVADVHHLLPESGLYVIGEYFQPIDHCLLGIKGTILDDINTVYSHVHAIPQCRQFIRKHKLKAIIHADTAGAAEKIAQEQRLDQAAIASKLAAEIYDLDVLANDIQDGEHNVTRMVVLSREPVKQKINASNLMTSISFEVRNIPAALYKALGGFATNGVNMMKLESYVDSQFNAARFYCEVEGHPEQKSLSLALEELSFFAKTVKLLGTFPQSDFRKSLNQK